MGLFCRVGAGDKKKAASKQQQQQQNLDGMLRKFHKEKLQELQLLKSQHDSSEQVDSGSADELHQAVEEQGEILTNDQSQKNQGTLAETLQASRPDGLSPAPERSLQELAQVLLRGFSLRGWICRAINTSALQE